MCRIREKDGGNFALSMCYKDGFRHYTINRIKTDDGELLALDDEPVFENIMDVSLQTDARLRKRPLYSNCGLCTPTSASVGLL